MLPKEKSSQIEAKIWIDHRLPGSLSLAVSLMTPVSWPATGQQLPAFLVGMRVLAPGSVLALAAQSHPYPRPAPVTSYQVLLTVLVSFEASDVLPLLDSVRHWPSWAVHWQHLLVVRPMGWRASCAGPAARKCQSRWLAGPAGDSLAISRASRQ